MFDSRQRALRHTFSSLLVLLFAAYLAGCGSSKYGSIDPGNIHPPFSQETLHPDSVAHLQVVAKDGKLKLKSDRSLQGLRLLWSSSFWDKYGGGYFETVDYRTYATLQSLELSLAELKTRGVEGLSEELARKMVGEQKETYRNYVVFDVHVFLDERYREAYGQSSLGEAGTSVVLVDGEGRQYTPDKIEIGTPRRYFSNAIGAPGAFHRLNTVYFKREVDGRDILADASSLELRVRTSVPSASLSFNWSFKGQAVAQS